jgi:starch synthase
MNELFAVVDATSKDNLEQLTLHRMPGALPYGGKFRLIDFTLSNIRNSQISNVAIFPYGNYRSLQDHIGSGKKWDLDRRKDGLFILPPKNLYILPTHMITFQRMYEHIEFFKRSKQDYCVITSANIVWNIDFNDVLQYHKQKEADITEVLYERIRLKTFIISKKLLLDYILSYDTLEYKTMSDLVEKAPNLNIEIYQHDTYTRTITDPFNYLKSNLDMLNFEIGRKLFRSDRPIFSKEKTAPPARYLNNAKVINSMVSSGAIIDGTIINSVIGRDVVIKKGAIVKNSFVMSNTFIEENAHLEYAILDKQSVVKKDTLALGSIFNPYITQKEQVVTNTEQSRILMIASESYPFIKTGGLADVIGSLSRNLVRQGADVTVFIPYYKKIRDSFKESVRSEFVESIPFGDKLYKVRVYGYTYKKVNYYFIDNFDFFDKDQVYGFDNDVERFAFFNKVCVAILPHFDFFDLIHLHDWHTGLVPLILKESPYSDIKTLLTIHNIDYQGYGQRDVLDKLNLKHHNYQNETINCLEIGINTASKLSTVSPTYKEELKYEYYGKNLTYSLLKRERDFYGVLNGISSAFNPDKDKLIYENYNVSTRHHKVANKRYLQEIMNLPMKEDYFVIGMVTRIVEQKGFDLILYSFRDLLLRYNDIQFVLLGTGDSRYESELQKLEEEFPQQIKLNLGYDSAVPNHIYAGADVFLMPSRFEPCGLGQMIALKYGTLPIVRETGGLNDTVYKYDPITNKGNGFTFFNYDAVQMKNTIIQAYELYKNDKQTWDVLIQRAMREDNSIKKSAAKYLELYRSISEN